MEALGHLFFELLKIWVLACVYTSMILVIARIFLRINSKSISTPLLDYRKRPWNSKPVVYWVIYFGLFLYMFSYWGDHGLGDESIVPIGHSKVVTQIDGTSTFIEDQKGNQFDLTNFAFDNYQLFARHEKHNLNDNGSDYIIWGLRSNQIKSFTDDDYIQIAKKNHYPLPQTFKNFDWYYQRYWNGWRFWLLP